MQREPDKKNSVVPKSKLWYFGTYTVPFRTLSPLRAEISCTPTYTTQPRPQHRPFKHINKHITYNPSSHIKYSTQFQYILCFHSRTVPGSIPGGVTGNFYRGSFRQNHVPWGRLSLWKWVPGISPGVKAAGAYGWRTTNLVVPNVEMIRGLNLPGTPRVTSACCGIPLTPLLPVSLHLFHFLAPGTSV